MWNLIAGSNVKTLMLPDAANSYVAGFGNLINDFTDDVYASVEDRIEHFEEFMENQLFIFRVQSNSEYAGCSVGSGPEVF